MNDLGEIRLHSLRINSQTLVPNVLPVHSAAVQLDGSGGTRGRDASCERSIRMSWPTEHGAREGIGKAPPASSRAPFTERGALRVFVRRDSFFTNWRDSLAALASRAVPQSSLRANYSFLREVDLTRVRLAGRPLAASVVLHCSLMALLIYLPGLMSATASPILLTAPLYQERIYYRVPLLHPAEVPRLAPAGPGGRPGSGSVPARVPALGSTAPHPLVTIVSKPVHPDNFRQTIYQRASPPDLRITTEQKLPNVISVPLLEKPKAPLVPSDARPTRAQRQLSTDPAPSVSSNINPASSLTTFLKPSDTQPKLPILLAGGGGPPIVRSQDGSGSAAGGSSVDAPDVLVLGVDPAASANQLSLPGGNRWGEFSIAPPSGTPGSPGGDPNGTVGGGSGGRALGGDGSTAVGSGSSGGGGGLHGTAGPVSITGPRAGGGPGGSLDPALLINMVYPVVQPALRIRKNALIISAGPIGGGALSVYGALKCGKIYSIFLPMPGKNWSMQYCDGSVRTQKVAVNGVIHLDKPLVPPDLDLGHRFDFRRIPVPIEKSHRSIILKGVIATDGSVQHLVVYQGVVPEMDEAARLAFSRWHFQPAMKDGKPVEVEVLVGIPPLAEEDRVSR